MSGRNFSLTPYLSDFIDRTVKSGQHQTASEVVREALRRYEAELKAQEADLAAIWAVAERGIADMERGDYTWVRGEEGSRALLKDLNRRAAARARRKKVAAASG